MKRRLLSLFVLVLSLFMLTSCSIFSEKTTDQVTSNKILTKDEIKRIVLNTNNYTIETTIVTSNDGKTETSIYNSKVDYKISNNIVKRYNCEIKQENYTCYYTMLDNKIIILHPLGDGYVYEEDSSFDISDFNINSAFSDISDDAFSTIEYNAETGYYDLVEIIEEATINISLLIENNKIVEMIIRSGNTVSTSKFSNVGTTTINIPSYIQISPDIDEHDKVTKEEWDELMHKEINGLYYTAVTDDQRFGELEIRMYQDAAGFWMRTNATSFSVDTVVDDYIYYYTLYDFGDYILEEEDGVLYATETESTHLFGHQKWLSSLAYNESSLNNYDNFTYIGDHTYQYDKPRFYLITVKLNSDNSEVLELRLEATHFTNIYNFEDYLFEMPPYEYRKPDYGPGMTKEEWNAAIDNSMSGSNGCIYAFYDTRLSQDSIYRAQESWLFDEKGDLIKYISTNITDEYSDIYYVEPKVSSDSYRVFTINDLVYKKVEDATPYFTYINVLNIAKGLYDYMTYEDSYYFSYEDENYYNSQIRIDFDENNRLVRVLIDTLFDFCLIEFTDEIIEIPEIDMMYEPEDYLREEEWLEIFSPENLKSLIASDFEGYDYYYDLYEMYREDILKYYVRHYDDFDDYLLYDGSKYVHIWDEGEGYLHETDTVTIQEMYNNAMSFFDIYNLVANSYQYANFDGMNYMCEVDNCRYLVMIRDRKLEKIYMFGTGADYLLHGFNEVRPKFQVTDNIDN